MGVTKFTIERGDHAIQSSDAGNALYRARVTAPADRPVEVRLISINFRHGTANEFVRTLVYKGNTGGSFTAAPSGISVKKRSDNTDAIQTVAGHTGAGSAITPGDIVARGVQLAQGGSFVRAYGPGDMVIPGGGNLDIFIENAGTLTGICNADIEIDAEE